MITALFSRHLYKTRSLSEAEGNNPQKTGTSASLSDRLLAAAIKSTFDSGFYFRLGQTIFFQDPPQVFSEDQALFGFADMRE